MFALETLKNKLNNTRSVSNLTDRLKTRRDNLRIEESIRRI